MINFILPGEVPSKKNSWALGNGRIFTPGDIKRWVKDSLWLLKPVLRKTKTITENCEIKVDFYIKHDKDIDNLLGSLFDLLQQAKIVENDRLIKTVIATKYKEKIMPRVQVWLHVV